MKLITIITILLLISVFLLIVNRKEDFAIIGENQREMPYKLSVFFDEPLRPYRYKRVDFDANGDPIDVNITACDEYKTDYYKYGEKLGSGENPEEYKDKNGNNCDFYRKFPNQCSPNRSYINSPLVNSIYRWVRNLIRDSPRDTCYVPNSRTDFDNGCDGGYYIKPTIIKKDNFPEVYLRNESRTTNLRKFRDLSFYPKSPNGSIDLQCYKVVDDLGHHKSQGKCGDSNKRHPNYKEVNIPGTEDDYIDLSNKCNNIHECQGFEVDLKNNTARFFGDSPYFDLEGTDDNTIIENGDGNKDFDCYKKKNFNLVSDNYKVMSGKCGAGSTELLSNYNIMPEVDATEQVELPTSSVFSAGGLDSQSSNTNTNSNSNSNNTCECPGENNKQNQNNTGDVDNTENENEVTTKSVEENLLDTCKNECDNVPECIGFNLSKDQNGNPTGCKLFGERPDWVPTEDWNSDYNVAKVTPMLLSTGIVPDILNRNESDPDCYKKINNEFIEDENFVITSGTCRGGKNLAANPPIFKSNDNKQTCREKCMENHSCQGYAYNDKTSTCKLYGYMNNQPDIPAFDENNPNRLHIKIERGNPLKNDIVDGEDFTPQDFKFEKCHKKINYTYVPSFSETQGSCNVNRVPTKTNEVNDGEFNENCALQCLSDISCQGYTLNLNDNTCVHHGYMDENPINSEHIIEPGNSQVSNNEMCYKKLNFNPILKNSVHNSNQNHSPKYGKCRAANGSYPGSYTIRNVQNLKQCADECGNSRETPNTCQGFDFNTNTNTCTLYGNDTTKYDNLSGATENSVVITGNREVVDGKNSVCYINNKFTPVNTEILK